MSWDADFSIELDVDPLLVASFNCECEGEAPRQTLLQMRQAMLIRLGFAAQVNNPPPGMASLMDSFLQDAQIQVHQTYQEKRIQRFFRWPLTPGLRFYGVQENTDGCAAKLDPRQLSWVGIRELNGTWYPLIHGIPPEMYSRGMATTGWPTRYEIRDCIEIFPAPRTETFLMVKGFATLGAFSADTDYVTMDAHAVFLLALANGKAHYNKPDADNVFAQFQRYLLKQVGSSHQTARYIPTRRFQHEAAVRPRMIEFDA